MATGNYPKYTDEFKKSIVTLHQNGKSFSQLSKELRHIHERSFQVGSQSFRSEDR